MATNKRFIAKNGVDNNNQTLTNVATPSAASDAATKAFSENASNLSTGTVPAARMPALTGDVTSNAGSVTTSLAASTVLNKLLTVDGVGSGLDADLLDGLHIGQSGTNYIPYVDSTSNFRVATNIILNNSGFDYTINASTLTANRILTLPDSAGTLVVSSGGLSQFSNSSTTSAQLASVLSDETGTGSVVFNTNPIFLTSLQTTSTSFNILTSTVTTVSAFSAATTLSIGNSSSAAGTHNYSTGATSSGNTKIVNLGTGGASGSTTNINIAPIGSLGTTIIGNALNPRGQIRRTGNMSSSSWTSVGIAFDSASAVYNDTTGSGTISVRTANTFSTPTFASDNAVTVSNASNLYIAGPPAAGTNTTILDSWSFWSNSGSHQMVGGLNIGSTINPNRGPITAVSIQNAGSGYTNGTYTNVALTGGSAASTAARADITVSGGIVTSVVIAQEGGMYRVGDVLSASVAGGSGLEILVTSVRSVMLQCYGNSAPGLIRLGNNAQTNTGTQYGSLLFFSNDNSAGGSGDRVRLTGIAEGGSGGGALQIWTAANGQEPTLCAAFHGNNEFRIYNSTGSFYHSFVNAPTANRTFNLPDANVTFSGANALTITTTAATTVTLPSGTNTLASLTGTETLTNKTILGRATSKNASATLTTAEVTGGFIYCGGTADITLTLPTGASLDGVNTTNDSWFDLAVFTTTAFAVILAANTGVTILGNASTSAAANSFATFRLRRVSANTWTAYRIS